MKTTITILFISLGIGFVHAQEIPKRASQIFIHNNKTQGENFIYVSKHLVSENIEIEKRDQSLGTITTAVYSPSKTNPIMLMFFCQDSVIRITGNFKLGMDINIGGVVAKDNLSKIENRGMKGSPFKKTFEAINNVAKSLSSESELTYK